MLQASLICCSPFVGELAEEARPLGPAFFVALIARVDPPHPRATEAGPAQASRSAGDANGGINPPLATQVSKGTRKTKDMIGKK
jgi:hypothetical protein